MPQAERRLALAHEGLSAADDALIDVTPTTIAGVSALLAYAADHECAGRSWPTGYYEQDAKTGWDRKHGVSWKFLLHKNLAQALPSIAA
jgi:hypothetical protein